MKPRYFIDMDGVLAVWNPNATEEESHERGYFLKRDIELSVVTFVRMLITAGYDVSVLSSVYQDDHSIQEKELWLDNAGLNDIKRIFVPYGEDKHKYIKTEGCLPVLIDDFSKNLTAWEKEGYLSIKFFNGVNNMPKLKVVDGKIEVKTDTWAGYSIDNRMSPPQMYNVVVAVATAEAKARATQAGKEGSLKGE